MNVEIVNKIIENIDEDEVLRIYVSLSHIKTRPDAKKIITALYIVLRREGKLFGVVKRELSEYLDIQCLKMLNKRSMVDIKEVVKKQIKNLFNLGDEFDAKYEEVINRVKKPLLEYSDYYLCAYFALYSFIKIDVEKFAKIVGTNPVSLRFASKRLFNEKLKIARSQFE